LNPIVKLEVFSDQTLKKCKNAFFCQSDKNLTFYTHQPDRELGYYHIAVRDNEQVDLMKNFKMVHDRRSKTLFVLCKKTTDKAFDTQFMDWEWFRKNIMERILGFTES
jgi:hypothetical protein